MIEPERLEEAIRLLAGLKPSDEQDEHDLLTAIGNVAIVLAQLNQKEES